MRNFLICRQWVINNQIHGDYKHETFRQTVHDNKNLCSEQTLKPL
jgi:hypothetical protein